MVGRNQMVGASVDIAPVRSSVAPLLAQIMGIVDVFDALTMERPYRVALPVAWAVEELRREVARGWHRADLAAAFLDQVERR